MRIFVDIALANIVVSKVRTHEVIRLGALSANAASLLHGRQVKPLVVIFADVIVIHRQEARTLHIVGVTEEHNLLGILTHIHGKRSNLAFALGASLIDECHREFGAASITIRAILDFLHDIAPGQVFCSHHGTKSHHQNSGLFQHFRIHISSCRICG